MQVLIVEDDVRLAQALAHILAENGYQTDVVHDGASGLAYAECGDYDVIILDVMLPKMDGFAVVAQLRRKSISVPVLLLTARDAVPDKITGLDSGADDYMTKPFAPAELLAHLRALTRRQGEVLFEKLAAGDLVLNLEATTWRAGRSPYTSATRSSRWPRCSWRTPGRWCRRTCSSRRCGAWSRAPKTTTWRPTCRFCARR